MVNRCGHDLITVWPLDVVYMLLPVDLFASPTRASSSDDGRCKPTSQNTVQCMYSS
jgi:hypothetical protein